MRLKVAGVARITGFVAVAVLSGLTLIQSKQTTPILAIVS